MIKRADLVFDPNLDDFFRMRLSSALTVLAGGNNAGKSLALKHFKQAMGRSGYMIGSNRFYHVYHFSSGLRDPREIDNFESQFQNEFRNDQFNYEQNFFDLNRIIMGLTDSSRGQLLALCGRLIGNEITMKKVSEDNDLSPRFIDVDGQNLSVASTGTRLLLTLLGICMDDRFSSILIDEPELGLSPRVQLALASFMQDPVERSRYFPHLERMVIATHSHVFLHRGDIESNFVVQKDEQKISLHQIRTMSEFHRLQFNLLGNSLDLLFFPSGIVIVEGKSDFGYIERLMELRFPGRRLTVVSAQGDVKKKVHSLREMLGELQKSPLQDRVFVVLDSIHQVGLTDELVKMGVPEKNIVRWKSNGIEYVYPPTILADVFQCGVDRVGELDVVDDLVSLGRIAYSKAQLAEEVRKRLTVETELPTEIREKLLDPMRLAIE